MTLVQLEYIIAIDTYRHFATAASHCFVTQPSLSAQVQKLEEELGVKIFDRSKQPVLPTESGKLILQQARKIMDACAELTDSINEKKNILTGELRLGVIPTIAPYLLPLFIPYFTSTFPSVKLTINELTTDMLVNRLREGRIDAGVLVTPLQESGITEDVLFYEELIAYVSPRNEAYKKNYVLATDINPNKLWLLEEGHCFRSQIVNLCELRKSSKEGSHFEYEAGSLETLRRMVEVNDGITILPELATIDLSPSQQKNIRFFTAPAPVREVSIITHRDVAKRRLIVALKQAIMKNIPEKVLANKGNKVVPI